jgi:hypothetical protein
MPEAASVADVDAAAAAESEPEASPEEEDQRIAEVEAALALDDEEGLSLAAPQSLIVAVGKPPDFFMAHPDPAMSQVVSGIFAPGMSKTFYLVGADMRAYLNDYLKRVQLTLCIDMSDNEFIWPILLPKMPGGEQNSWTQSALEAVKHARLGWRKLIYIDGASSYKIEPAVGNPAPPVWSGRPFAVVRNSALAGFVINDTKHPVAKRLREGKREIRGRKS